MNSALSTKKYPTLKSDFACSSSIRVTIHDKVPHKLILFIIIMYNENGGDGSQIFLSYSNFYKF